MISDGKNVDSRVGREPELEQILLVGFVGWSASELMQ